MKRRLFLLQKKLYLSQTDKKLFGVCGGIAEYFDIDSTIIRILWVILAFCYGIGILPYFLMALIIPKDTDGYYR